MRAAAPLLAPRGLRASSASAGGVGTVPAGNESGCACRQLRCQVVAAAALRPAAAPPAEARGISRPSTLSRSACSTSYSHLPARHISLSSRRGRGTLVCRASFLPDAVDATFRNFITISAAAGICYALLLGAATPEPPAPPMGAPGQKALGPGSSTSRSGSSRSGSGSAGEDNFVWGLMGFISCLPLFGWLSWALAAISDEDRAALYTLYAALYGSPLLLRGLDWNDPWALTMLALCVAHVQAERIAQTEPQTLRAIQPVAALGRLVRGAVGGTGSVLSGLSGVLAKDARRVSRRPGGRPDGGQAALGSGDDRLQLERDPDLVKRGGPIQDPRLDPTRDPELEDYAARELRQFDEQLRAAAEDKRRKQGQR
ncbi:hypothetical protein HYH02_000664 [Chlamydomonas schloesseri]|uniref:Uncharacterized protein n=1 Tax=Chlamydomonas schloesseri TaxID=2026947 RepID=A0A835WWR6_9CHLO|nr:hypothetical protein HYH02_000664 [Chlamydomonas schloesseri]|eukprot:KAG2454832.1 hypothetical protein HYH02_000664 [Chlamydomonas schloesseri]